MTNALETMYCFELVASAPPVSGKVGLIVFSSVQPNRPNHCERAFWLKSMRSVTWSLFTWLFCAYWKLLLGFVLFPGLTVAWGRNARSFCDVGSRSRWGIMLPSNG